VQQPAVQVKVAAAGFRPARGAARSDVIATRNGVDPAPHTSSVAPASPAAIEQALAHWQTDRRRARVLFLFDVSDSMGDLADPSKPQGPTKIQRARSALTAALGQLSSDDEIGLRTFTTNVTNSPSPNWSDVVPSGPLAVRRRALDRAIASLTPQQGSPLYAATRDAFDQVARGADPRRIDSVVVLTDGYNEDDHDNNLNALLSHLASQPDVRVFTITYSNDADSGTLRRIAQATNAWNFDARDTIDLADVLPRALASF
jgi:Ca-activated chloride channel family protein